MDNISLPHAVESVLILDQSGKEGAGVAAALVRELPDSLVDAVASVEALRDKLKSQPFDIVVLDHDLAGGKGTLELLHELKTLDVEPSVLVVTSSNEGRTINDLYRYGCDRCVVRDDRFYQELAPQVRHALRYRRLSETNRYLQARLIELNVLLEEKNKRLDEFSSTVAHDIRGPLSGLSMKLDFILDQYKTNLDQRCTTLLTNSQRSIERLMDMVQGMYEFAKLGSQANNMAEVDLEKVFEELAEDLDVAKSSEVKIHLGKLNKVWGNKGLLRRVFQNLLSNSIKYNSKSVIEISVHQASQYTSSLGVFGEFVLADNGVGIPQSEVPFIFDMFRRGSSSRTDESGAGIGLAVVRRIIELHYGKVTVESKEGEGTTFTIHLPLDPIKIGA